MQLEVHQAREPVRAICKDHSQVVTAEAEPLIVEAPACVARVVVVVQGVPAAC
jgi:hypothetical protein